MRREKWRKHGTQGRQRGRGRGGEKRAIQPKRGQESQMARGGEAKVLCMYGFSSPGDPPP